MKVVIAGSRTIGDISVVADAISASDFLITEIVSGGAKGIDSLAEQWAALHDVPIKVFLPDWEKYGRGAGPVRNSDMAEYADALIAIWDGKSKGTKDMISKAEKAGLKVSVFQPAT